MGKKKERNHAAAPAAKPAKTSKGFNPLIGGAIVVAALLWWGGIEILGGTLTFGGLVAFMQYTQRFYLPIRDASAKFSVMQAATVSAERVFGLLDTPEEASGTLVPVTRSGDARSLARRPRPPVLRGIGISRMPRSMSDKVNR